tara:strand:- start:1779 stop:2153 length:375 start_codon:yes stop_codon:yes gene_type:complete
MPNTKSDKSVGPADWTLIAKLSELNAQRPLLAVTLNERKYVLFQNENGELGLIGRHCPHRGADLFYGRLEDNGIRCPFHGWHFDRSGQCVEQPAEPEGSEMFKAIKVPMVELKVEGDNIFALAQ